MIAHYRFPYSIFLDVFMLTSLITSSRDTTDNSRNNWKPLRSFSAPVRPSAHIRIKSSCVREIEKVPNVEVA